MLAQARSEGIARPTPNSSVVSTRMIGDYDDDVDEVLKTDGLTATSGDRVKLRRAIKLAAEDEFLGTMVESEPVPTAMSDLRTLRLRRICEYMERTLSAHEIAAIFRVSTRQAIRLDDQMEATYPLIAKTWQLAAVRDSAKVVNLPVSPPAGEKAEIVVQFKRREGPLAAERLIERAGLGASAKIPVDGFEVIVPIGKKSSTAHDLVRDTLGLERCIKPQSPTLRNTAAPAPLLGSRASNARRPELRWCGRGGTTDDRHFHPQRPARGHSSDGATRGRPTRVGSTAHAGSCPTDCRSPSACRCWVCRVSFRRQHCSGRTRFST